MVAFCGGVGSGKTVAGGMWAMLKIVQHPACAGFIGANTYKQLAQSTLPPFFALLESCGYQQGRDWVFGTRPKQAWNYPSRYPTHEGILSFFTGAQVITRSLENYDDYRGIQIGWFWIDETRDTKREAFDVLLSRLRDPNIDRHEGRITTTPDGFTWLYECFLEPGTPGYRLITASSRENPTLPAGYVDALETAYSTDLARQEIEGEFIAVGVGRVYSSFIRGDHLLVDLDRNRELPLILACDFNLSPLCWVVLQEYDRFTMALDEIVLKPGTTPETAREFVRRYGDHKTGVRVYGDATQETKTAITGKSDYRLIEEVLRSAVPGVSLHVPKSNPPVVDPVNAGNARLRNARGEIRLRVHPRCRGLIRDLEQVSWKPGTKNLDSGNLDLTHLSDALGYYVAARWPVIGRMIPPPVENSRLISAMPGAYAPYAPPR